MLSSLPRLNSRRSGKHLPAREKNWSSAVPYPSPSPAHVRSIPKQRSQRVRHYGSSSARSPDTADTAAPHRPRRAEPLVAIVIVGHKAAPHAVCVLVSLQAASPLEINDKIGRRSRSKRHQIATTSGSHHQNNLLRIHRTQPLQRCASPWAPQLKPSSNRFEPTAQHSGSP